MPIVKPVIWGLVVPVTMTISNLVLSLPLGIYAQKTWAAQSEGALAKGVPVAEALPRKGVVAIVYGVLAGALIAGGVEFLTRVLISSHWLYQVILGVGSFFAAGQLQERYLRAGIQGRSMFGLTGDRTIAVMYGGYGWGAVLGILSIGVWSWLR
jgi:hypothetical protein